MLLPLLTTALLLSAQDPSATDGPAAESRVTLVESSPLETTLDPHRSWLPFQFFLLVSVLCRLWRLFG